MKNDDLENFGCKISFDEMDLVRKLRRKTKLQNRELLKTALSALEATLDSSESVKVSEVNLPEEDAPEALPVAVLAIKRTSTTDAVLDSQLSDGNPFVA